MLLGIAILLAGAPAWQAAACEGLEVVFEDKFADDAGGWQAQGQCRGEGRLLRLKLHPTTCSLNVTFTVHDADICSETVWPTGDQPILARLLFWGEDNRSTSSSAFSNNGKYWIARKQDGKWLGAVRRQCVRR